MASGSISTGFRSRWRNVTGTLASVGAGAVATGSTPFTAESGWTPNILVPRFTSSGMAIVSAWFSGGTPPTTANFSVYNCTGSAKTNETITLSAFEYAN